MPSRLLAFALVFGLALAACSPTDRGEAPVDVAEPTIVEGASGSDVAASPRPEREPLLPEDGYFVAQPKRRYMEMWKTPRRREQPDFAFDTHNPFGQVAPLLIQDAVRRDGDAWYEVLLPIRPNGTTAWIKVDDVKIREREERIEVDLSRRTLSHFDGNELVDRFRIGIGTEQYPTGIGQFYVWVKVPYENPSNPYGIMALGLSGFSPVLSDWPGGGRMAVHGTPYESDRGQAVSHGCVRVYNADMRSLVDLPLGTPVAIRR